MVKLAIGSKVVTVSQHGVRPVTQKEYDKLAKDLSKLKQISPLFPRRHQNYVCSLGMLSSNTSFSSHGGPPCQYKNQVILIVELGVKICCKSLFPSWVEFSQRFASPQYRSPQQGSQREGGGTKERGQGQLG